MFKRNFMMLDANAGGGGGNSGGSGSNGDGTNSAGSSNTDGLTFETWHESLPQEHKTLIESHTKGLKSALDSERETRKGLEKQLRDLAKKAEEGSEAQAQLTQLADGIQAADRKAEFYEAAHLAGVKNLKLAYTAALNDEMFDKHGRVNFDEMKKQYPELFAGKTLPAGNAGEGTNQNNVTEDMNSRIRRAAGRE